MADLGISKGGGGSPGAVEFLGSCFDLRMRTENKNIVNIACGLLLKYLRVTLSKFTKTTPAKHFLTGGRAPGVPVLDPPLKV